jgi:hypothetical protein
MTRDLHTSAYADISLIPVRDESHEGCSTETEGFEPTRAFTLTLSRRAP